VLFDVLRRWKDAGWARALPRAALCEAVAAIRIEPPAAEPGLRASAL
jgi:hypothetical protein